MTKLSPRKLVASVALVATLGGGAFALSSVLPAGAQTGPSSSSGAPAAGANGPRAKAKAALDGLVTDGTIIQSQEDAVIAALQGAVGGKGGGRGGLRGRGVLQQTVQVAADKIGVSADELKTELKAGKSIADVAGEHKVSVDDVKAALIAAGTDKVQQAVAANMIDQAKAVKIIARLPAIADKVVNHHKGDQGPGA